MTFVGHSLAGASLAVLVVPSAWRNRQQAALVAGFVVLANLPDLPVPYWGHDRYEVSHSLFVTLGLLGVGYLGLLLPVCRRLRTAPWVWGGGGLAWLSHLLLDTFYNHGKGLAVFWPFGTARVSLALPWFETLGQPLWQIDAHLVRVLGIELLAYGLVFAVALASRWSWQRVAPR